MSPNQAPDDPDGPDTYTFGDSPLAAARLELLAWVYAPASEDLLSRWSPSDVTTAVDLGCGPGHSTRLVARVSGAAMTIGLERSLDFLTTARAASEPTIPAPGTVSFVAHDVTRFPLPVPRADLIHARFLLTHLSEPSPAVAGWVGALAIGGRLVLQETARLVSADPALGAYYEAVAALQAHHGQDLGIGAHLADLAPTTRVRILHSARRVLAPPVPVMARIHALNLQSWRTEEAARELFDPGELDGLAEALWSIAAGASPEATIEQELGELVLERLD